MIQRINMYHTLWLLFTIFLSTDVRLVLYYNILKTSLIAKISNKDVGPTPRGLTLGLYLEDPRGQVFVGLALASKSRLGLGLCLALNTHVLRAKQRPRPSLDRDALHAMNAHKAF